MPSFTQPFTLLTLSPSPFSGDFSLEFTGSAIGLESVDGTSIPPSTSILASTVTGQPSTGSLDTWTVTSGQQLARNGGVDPATQGVTEAVYHNHTLYQFTTFNAWWYWSTQTPSTPWLQYSITAVNLTAGTYAANTPANTTLGSISVVFLQNEPFDGVLTVSDTTNFKIVGSNLVSNVTLTATSYSFTITATPNVVGTAVRSSVLTINQTGTVVPVAYGTSAPATLPATTGAVSPLNWTVDFFDDFTGTFTRTNFPNWFTRANPNGFTTGATYNGQLAQYGCFWANSYGGYSGTDDITLISMSNSAINFGCTTDGRTSSLVMVFPNPWGLWEFRYRAGSAANGNNLGIGNAVWMDGFGVWPQAGEFDLNESGFGSTLATTVHLGPTAGVDQFVSLFSSSTYPGTGGSFDDGLYHTYSALITPAYIAFYFDGVQKYASSFTGSSSTFLKNINVTTYPPFTNTAGSFGYLANNYLGDPAHLVSNATWMIVVGTEYVANPSGSFTFNPATQFPTTSHLDWIRHSVLNPGSGGPHL